jgi:hypothetical protein
MALLMFVSVATLSFSGINLAIEKSDCVTKKVPAGTGWQPMLRVNVLGWAVVWGI